MLTSVGDGELVTNGDFSDGLNGWIDVNDYWVVTPADVAFHAPGSTFNLLMTSGISDVGTTARIKFDVLGYGGVSGLRVSFRDVAQGPLAGPLYGNNQTNPAITVNGSYDITVTIPAASFYLSFARDTAGESATFQIDNVSVIQQ